MIILLAVVLLVLWFIPAGTDDGMTMLGLTARLFALFIVVGSAIEPLGKLLDAAAHAFN